MLPELLELDLLRRNVLRLNFAAASCALTGGVALIFSRLAPVILLVPVSFIGFVFLCVTAYRRYGTYRELFKHCVFREVVRFIDPGLHYEPEGYVALQTFKDGKLFEDSPDSYGGDDRVHGMLGRTRLEFSEVHAAYKSSSTDSNSKATWITIFHGLYFVADFNKHFRTETVVLPEATERALGFIERALRSIKPTRGKLIRLEDPEFEREFVVYGEDQVEARYILTPALMQRMLALKRKARANIWFAFTGSAVHVAIAIPKQFFEPPLRASIVDFALLDEFHDDLRLVIGIVEDLNLNTRIWTKE